MHAQLVLLAVLYRVWGSMSLLLGASMLLLAGGALAIGFSSPADPFAAQLTAAAFIVVAGILLAAGIANAWAGTALGRHRPSGRMATLALAVPNLFVLPFGTALGIYAFWVLMHDETRRIFQYAGSSGASKP